MTNFIIGFLLILLFLVDIRIFPILNRKTERNTKDSDDRRLSKLLWLCSINAIIIVTLAILMKTLA